MRPFLLEPLHDYTIWGANHISKARGIQDDYGTWWEVSAHPYCSNKIKGTNKTLMDVIQEDPDSILGKGYTLHDMLRLAYLDTKDALSIQVHPEDEYALKHANDYGKYESWYILDAAPHATLVAGTTINDASKIKESLLNNSVEQYLNKIEVHKGDYVIIPSGMLHALGKNILAIEVGTNSNTTYRFYDYNRKGKDGKPRPLHIKESFDVADFSLKPTFVPAKKETHRIGDCPNFTVDEIYAEKDIPLVCEKHYMILSNMGNDCHIIWNEETITLPKYDSLFVPFASKAITIQKGAHVLVSNPRKQD